MAGRCHWIAAAFALVACNAAVHAAGLPVKAPVIDASPFLGDHYPPRKTSFPGGVVSLADVTYQILPGYRPLTLDLYLAPPRSSSTASPLVIYIHGGGWANGHSRQSGAFDDFPSVLASMAARGYVVASLNYRLSSEAPFPAAIQDVKAAIRWLRVHAAEYGIDKAKVLVWGGSAGGHLAALAATTCGVAELEPVTPGAAAPDAPGSESDCVQAAVTWYGVFDFASMPAPLSPTIVQFLRCSASQCPADTVHAASPIQHVSKGTPPFLLVHGSADKTVDPAQSQAFHDAMVKAGASVDMLIIPGADHSFIGATPDATREASLTALARTQAFIDHTVGPMAK